MKSVYKKIQENVQKEQKMLGVLIDPDKCNMRKLSDVLNLCRLHKVDFILVGGSLLMQNRFEEVIIALKKQKEIPIIIFPGNGFQVSSKADAILFTSLLSGRNPEYLIGQQMQAAPHIREANIESIGTAYLLIESGSPTSVSYISNTQAIPANKSDIAVATAMAAEMMGMQMIYLEAGSGAKNPVNDDMIRQVKKHIKLPLICGGGINDIETALSKYNAGADIIVIGNGAEKDVNLIGEIAQVRKRFTPVRQKK